MEHLKTNLIILNIFFVLLFVSHISCTNRGKEVKRVSSLGKNDKSIDFSDSHLDSVSNLDYINSMFSGLYKDTLLLKSEFSECGEFGGSIEVLKIYKNNDSLEGVLLNKEIDCQSLSKPMYQIVDEKRYLFAEHHQKEIMVYLKNLLILYFLEQKSYPHKDNIRNVFTAKINSPLEYSEYNVEKPFLISVSDKSLKWEGYNDLKRALKGAMVP